MPKKPPLDETPSNAVLVDPTVIVDLLKILRELRDRVAALEVRLNRWGL